MKKTIFYLALCSNLLFGANIKSINFEGLKHISPIVAQSISGLNVGDMLTGDNTDRAILNLFKQGYFSDAYISETNGDVIIHLKEKPIIAKIDLKGPSSNDIEKIQEIMGLKLGQSYDELAIKIAKIRIKQFYEAKGYFDTVVEIEKTPINDDKNSLHLTTVVNRGEKIIIKKVNLIGAKKLNYSKIEPAIANKQRELLGWMWGFNDGNLKTIELVNDPNRIKDEYLKKGYLDATISAPFLNAYMNNYTAELTYYIHEGERYKVTDVSIESPAFLNLDTDNIIKKFKLEAGDRFSSKWLRHDMQKLENLVADKGFAYVEVFPALNQDKDKKEVAIKYVIKPYNEIYVRNVSISGNDKTSDKVIRREMYLTEGQKYNRTDLSDSVNSLKRTGYFDNVNVSEKKISENEIDLNIAVEEAPTGSITGGIGYGSGDGLLLSASLSDRNIFGSGIKGSINVEKSDDKLSGGIGFTNPRLYDSIYSLSGNLYARDLEWSDYKERAYGFNATIGRKISRYASIYLTYEFEKSKIKGLDEFYAVAGYQNDKNTKSSLTPAIRFDNTDDYFIPRSGMIAGLSAEYAGLGGNMKYLKTTGDFKWFFGLRDYVDYDLIFRYKANFGLITNEKANMPVNEKLFLGGMSTIRGYDGRSIPREKVCIQGKGCKYIETGGKKSFNNSFELSFPLIDRINMRFITFFDYGMVGNNNFKEEKRYSTGAGIEWRTPMGPLQLFWVKPLNKKSYDSVSNFEFTVGTTF